MPTNSFRRGFTLIELLLVIGIIAILAAIVIVAINPTKQLADARNAQRRSDVNTILNAYWQYAIDNSGRFQPTSHDGAAILSACQVHGTAARVCRTTANNLATTDHCGESGVTCVYSGHLSGTYVTSIPSDPQDSTAATEDHRVDYTIRYDSTTSSGRLTVNAPSAEQSATITVTR